MKWLKQNKWDLYLRVRDYFGFGEEYFAEYEFNDIDDCKALSQELTVDMVSSSMLDEELLPF